MFMLEVTQKLRYMKTHSCCYDGPTCSHHASFLQGGPEGEFDRAAARKYKAALITAAQGWSTGIRIWVYCFY